MLEMIEEKKWKAKEKKLKQNRAITEELDKLMDLI